MRIFALIAIPVLLAAQQTTPKPEDVGIIAGQIRSADGVPLAGVRIATVAVQSSDIFSREAAFERRMTTTGVDGSFRLEDVRPGRYYISAGPVDEPTYYPGVPVIADARIITVVADATGAKIDFSLVQPPAVKVSGRIKGTPGNLPAGLIRVALAPVTTGATVPRPTSLPEAPVLSNGTFEFQGVRPGTYAVRTTPALTVPPPEITIEVKNSDVGPVELTSGPILVGQVTVEDGSALPAPASVAPGNANRQSFVQIAIAPVNPSVRTQPGSSVRADGAFMVTNIPAGDYRVGARMLPFGYAVKSISFGGVDLMQSPLKVDSPGSSNIIRMVLTSAPTPGPSDGFQVSGRVLGAAPLPGWISMIMSTGPGTGSVGRMDEAVVRSDGTFTFQRVPPGSYSVRPVPPAFGSIAITLLVTDRDIANLSIATAPEPVSAPVAGTILPPGTSVVAVQPPSFPAGVSVSGRVMISGSAGNTPRAVILFGPRDGVSVQAPLRADGTFEIPNVQPGRYDARTLPLLTSVSTSVVVGNQDVNGVTLNISPGTTP